jgi:hypothetical protein
LSGRRRAAARAPFVAPIEGDSVDTASVKHPAEDARLAIDARTTIAARGLQV